LNPISLLKNFKLDKLADFETLVIKKAEELQEKNKELAIKKSTKKVLKQKAVEKYRYETQRWTKKELLDLKCDGTFYNRDISFDFKSEYRHFYRFLRCLVDYSGYIEKKMYKPHIDGFFSDHFFIFERRFQTKKTDSFFHHSLFNAIKCYAEVDFELAIPYDGLENFLDDVESEELDFKYKDIDKYIDEARELILSDFVSKYKPNNQ